MIGKFIAVLFIALGISTFFAWVTMSVIQGNPILASFIAMIIGFSIALKVDHSWKIK